MIKDVIVEFAGFFVYLHFFIPSAHEQHLDREKIKQEVIQKQNKLTLKVEAFLKENFSEKKLINKSELVTFDSRYMYKVHTCYEADFDRNGNSDWAVMLYDKDSNNIEFCYIIDPGSEHKLIKLDNVHYSKMKSDCYFELKSEGKMPRELAFILSPGDGLNKQGDVKFEKIKSGCGVTIYYEDIGTYYYLDEGELKIIII